MHPPLLRPLSHDPPLPQKRTSYIEAPKGIATAKVAVPVLNLLFHPVRRGGRLDFGALKSLCLLLRMRHQDAKLALSLFRSEGACWFSLAISLSSCLNNRRGPHAKLEGVKHLMLELSFVLVSKHYKGYEIQKMQNSLKEEYQTQNSPI